MSLPLPPLDMRRMVGPAAPEAFDNPSGAPIYDDYGMPHEVYDSVFDFGCGCGRVTRQLLLQTSRPRRYVGIDVHPAMVRWCRENLAPVAPGFQFFHHDVYSSTYAPGNSTRLADPFPVEDGAFSLVIAHSVFTHLTRPQTDYYLHEVARILAPKGLAFTSWFFFDRESFPFLREGPYCLYASESDPSQAVVYDRGWFVQALRRAGLGVRRTVTPAVAGYQWTVILGRREPGLVDAFPLGAEGAEWLCGATARPRAPSPVPTDVFVKSQLGDADVGEVSDWPRRPPLVGPLAEIEALRRPLRSKLWRAAKTAAARALRR